MPLAVNDRQGHFLAELKVIFGSSCKAQKIPDEMEVRKWGMLKK